MVDMGTGTLGEVKVKVSADLSKLIDGFANAKQQTNRFADDLDKVSRQTRLNAADTSYLEGQYRRLARAYDPVHAAQLRYTEDLTKIGILQRTGFIDSGTAVRWGERAGAEFDKARGGMGQMASAAGLAKHAMHGLIAYLGIESVRGIAEFIDNSLKATASIKNMSEELGLSTRQFQEWRGIAVRLGIDTNDMSNAFKQFRENVGQAAAGQRRESKAFELLGVSLKNSKGDARDFNDILGDTIEALHNVHDPLQRSAGAVLLFGETAGPKMAALLDAGKTKIDELRDAVEATGEVLSEDQIQNADEAAKKLDQVKTVLSAQIAGVVADNADAIIGLADAIGSVIGVAIQAAAALADFYRQAANLKNVDFSQFGTMPGAPRGSAPFGPSMASKFALDPAGKSKDSVTRKVPLNPYDPSVTRAQQRLNAEFSGNPSAKGPNLSSLLAPNPPKPKKPRKSGGGHHDPMNTYDREAAQVEIEHLRLLRDQSTDLSEINDLDKKIIDARLAQSLAQIDISEKGKHLTSAQAEELRKQERINAALEKEAADHEMRVKQIEDVARYAGEINSAEQDMLATRERLSRTDKERTAIEAAILRLKQQQEVAEIDKSIALAKENKDLDRINELTELRRKLLERQGVETQAFAKEHLTGIEKFKDELPKTVDEINQAIDNIRFDILNQHLQQAAQFAQDVGDAFGNAAARIANFEKPLDVLRGLLQDLSKTLTENFIQKPVSDWATKHIGLPLSKQAFGKTLGKDGLDTAQMNMALNLASQNVNQLAAAAAAASANLAGVGGGGGGGAAGAAELLGNNANAAASGLDEAGQQATQFGSGLMQVLSSLAGGGGGGGLGGLLSMGLSIFGAATGAGGLGGVSGALGSSALDFATPGMGSLAGALGGGLNFASGGGFTVLGNQGTDQNTLSINGKEIANVSYGERISVGHDEAFGFGGAPGGGMTSLGGGMMDFLKSLSQQRAQPQINLGGVHLYGVSDERSARRAVRQVSGDLQREIALGVRKGYPVE